MHGPKARFHGIDKQWEIRANRSTGKSVRTFIFLIVAIVAALGYRLYLSPKQEQQPTPVAEILPSSGIHVISATYGPNCNGQPGNATRAVAGACNGKNS